MKVLFITNIPSPYRVAFFNELGKMCDLTVTYEARNATDRDKNWHGECEISYKAIFLKGIRVKTDSAFCPGIINVLSRKWDWIIVGVYSSVSSMIAIRWMKRKRIPFLIEADGGMIKKDNVLTRYIKTSLISSAKWWLSSGKQTSDYLLYYGASEDRIYVFPFSSIRDTERTICFKADDHVVELHSVNSIEEQKKYFKWRTEIRELKKRELGVTNKKVILYVGQYIFRKGIDVLLRALARLKPEDKTTVFIVGGTPTKEYIELASSCKEVEVCFQPFEEKNNLLKYFYAADLFVLPTREDIWGLVVIEAMAHGVPVITTDRCVAGLEVIEEGVDGVIFPNEDVGKLTGLIEEYLFKKDLVALSEAAYNKSALYTIENMAERHIEIFEHLNKERQ